MIRRRAKWLEEGERPSRFFFNLQRSKAQRSHISSVHVYDSDGNEVFSQEKLRKRTWIFSLDSFLKSR